MADKKGGGKKATMTKSQFFQEIADKTEMKKSEVVKVYEAMYDVVQNQLGPKGPGVVTLPNIAKLTAVHTKASKGGERKPNPFKPGEFIITKPKPARTKIKARGLKGFLETILRK
jgi:nucleoid DNA-binding protein